MIRSCVTISLVPEADGGPFVFWDDLRQSCRQAAEIGFDAVELFVPGAGAIDRGELKEILSEHSLKLAAVGTGAGYLLQKLHLCDPDAAGRRRAVEFIAEIIEFAGAFGAMAIVGSMQGRIGTGQARTDAEGWLREGLDRLGELAGEHGVPVLLEPLNRYETNCINRLEQGATLIGSLQTGNVGLLADLFHMNIEEQSVCEALRAAAGLVRHVHFVDSNRRPAGCGHTDFRAVGRVLREIAYNGYLSAEALPYPNSQAAAEQTMLAFKVLQEEYQS